MFLARGMCGAAPAHPGTTHPAPAGRLWVVRLDDSTRPKILVLVGHSDASTPAVEALKARYDVVEIQTIEQAVEALRHEQFTAIFSDSADFLPLERALVGQQANLILNTIGEGVCIVDGEGRCNWMNNKMKAWPARVLERIRRSCKDAFDLFTKQVSPAGSQNTPQTLDTPPAPSAAE